MPLWFGSRPRFWLSGSYETRNPPLASGLVSIDALLLEPAFAGVGAGFHAELAATGIAFDLATALHHAGRLRTKAGRKTRRPSHGATTRRESRRGSADGGPRRKCRASGGCARTASLRMLTMRGNDCDIHLSVGLVLGPADRKSTRLNSSH